MRLSQLEFVLKGGHTMVCYPRDGSVTKEEPTYSSVSKVNEFFFCLLLASN